VLIFSYSWIIILPFSLYFIYKYYEARKENNLSAVKIYQPLSTILSLAICIMSYFSSYSNVIFTSWIIVGMFIALIADFLNIDMGDFKVVIRGLLIFFLAYLTYVITTFLFVDINIYTIIVILIMILIFSFIFSLVWRGFENNIERVAMGLYGVLISIMVAGGLNTFFSERFSIISSIFITLGYIFLFLGDIEFALSTYWKPFEFEYGPFLYAGGQLFIAISLFFPLF